MIDRNSLTKIERIIYEKLNESIIQNDHSVDQVFLQIKNSLYSKETIAIEKSGVVLLITPETKWIARGDFFADSKTYSNMVLGAKSVTQFVFSRTHFNKIYGFITDKRFITIGKKFGWKLQGTLTKSYWDGKSFIDQFILGVTREDFFEFLEKKKS